MKTRISLKSAYLIALFCTGSLLAESKIIRLGGGLIETRISTPYNTSPDDLGKFKSRRTRANYKQDGFLLILSPGASKDLKSALVGGDLFETGRIALTPDSDTMNKRAKHLDHKKDFMRLTPKLPLNENDSEKDEEMGASVFVDKRWGNGISVDEHNFIRWNVSDPIDTERFLDLFLPAAGNEQPRHVELSTSDDNFKVVADSPADGARDGKRGVSFEARLIDLR